MPSAPRAGARRPPISDPQITAIFTRAFNEAGSEYAKAGAPFLPFFAQALADRAALRPGHRVFDVATGPGTVVVSAAKAVGRSGSILGIDLAEGQMSLARTIAHTLDAPAKFQHLDAQRLTLPDDGFDAALCGFGLPYFADPVRAVREMARVTRPGGVVAATIWAAAFFAPAGTRLLEVMERFEVPLLHRPFGVEIDELAQWWLRAGLRDVEIDDHALPLIFPAFADWWRFNHVFAFLVRLGAVDAGTRQTVLDAHRSDATAVRPDGSVAVTVRVYLVRGTV